jgi:hypothetical protein
MQRLLAVYARSKAGDRACSTDHLAKLHAKRFN